MIKIHCYTNLDLCHCEKWPTELPAVPHVGDIIQSSHVWDADREWLEKLPTTHGCEYIKRSHHYGPLNLELVVVRVLWKHKPKKEWSIRQEMEIDTWGLDIELHLPTNRFKTITDFYEWYGRVCGRGKSAFI